MEIFERILQGAIEAGASDVHLKIGAPVIFRIAGELVPVDAPPPAAEWMQTVLGQIVPAHLRARLDAEHEVDFAYTPPGGGRFRVNVFQQRGGYVLADAPGAKAAILATGSEVPLALAAQIQLADAGIAVRVVSMPSTNVFDRQDAAYRAAVLPKGMPRVAVEAGVTDFWRKYVGLEGAVIGIDCYGESAPAGELYKYFGITSEAVAAAVKQVLSPR